MRKRVIWRVYDSEGKLLVKDTYTNITSRFRTGIKIFKDNEGKAEIKMLFNIVGEVTLKKGVAEIQAIEPFAPVFEAEEKERYTSEIMHKEKIYRIVKHKECNYVYSRLFGPNGELLAEGTKNQICKKIKVNPGTVSTCRNQIYVDGIGECKFEDADPDEFVPFSFYAVELKTTLTYNNVFNLKETSYWKLECGIKEDCNYYNLYKDGELILAKGPKNIADRIGTTEYFVKMIEDVKEIETYMGKFTIEFVPAKKPKKKKHYKKTESEMRAEKVSIKKINEQEKRRLKKKMAKMMDYKIEQGKKYQVNKIHKNLEFVRSDFDNLYFRADTGYLLSFPRHKALTEVVEMRF